MPEPVVQETLRCLWDAAGRGEWDALRRLYDEGCEQVRHDEATALSEGAEPLFWMHHFIQWAPTTNPRLVVDELEGKIAGAVGASFAQTQTHHDRVELARRALAAWYKAVDDAQPDEATAGAMATRLIDAAYASIRRAYHTVVSAAEDARTLEQLGPVHDEAVEPLKAALVRAWWDRTDGVPDLPVRDIEDALDGFTRKFAFFKQNLPRLVEGEINLAEFIRRADAENVALVALPPGRSLTELVEPLTSLEQTVASLQRDFEQTLEGLGADLRRAREARVALMETQAGQALMRAWMAAYAFDVPALNRALNEAKLAIEALDPLVTGPQFATEMDGLWHSYRRLERYYDALLGLPAASRENLPVWRDRLLVRNAQEPAEVLLPAERGRLVQLIKRIKEPELADAVKFLLELDARLRLEQPVPGEVYAQSEAEQEFYRQYNALRKALLMQRDAPAPGEHAGEVNAALRIMWRKLPALSEAMRPLAQDLMRQWGNIDASAVHLRLNFQRIARHAATAKDPRDLLDALHLHLQTAPPEAFYLAHPDWQAAFDAVGGRFARWSGKAHSYALDAVRDLAGRKHDQGRSAFFDASEPPLNAAPAAPRGE